ncbi:MULTISPECIES: hypothetical protein [Streptomyces]|jgi:hypothetical protein|uniref:Putative secreted protein n=1 Tax=Streptomyces scabiei (strain 87.22) TaxID=680198 RepID=C9Z9A7_STRSW|nr:MULTISPECIES: hypothetical protein [Streptomyces]MBP5863787.1 hypothetical protein [Streptomyces sp. LBUM 1484]MBP5867244.1 hypothetical protein [Streptomyces sp. LBUM 1485]MBP5931583.1 hypothetical protein [Streptomyces sp. LBUM 1479]KFG09771.1 hypothetical protein IQ61_06355 [Streptomyces scabiei]MBP5875603.1 hypothetical protein [Streptomyces sp. LBUM 1477]
MRRIRLGAGSALLAGTLAVGGLALAPTAAAVTPDVATINATCTIGGSGVATLTATQDGTSATVTVTSEGITAPIALAEDSIQSTLTLVNASGGTVAFTGTENPALAAGDGVQVGPLTGTVAPGDSLDAFGGSLQMVIFGFPVTCTAGAAQSPGPFVFD